MTRQTFFATILGLFGVAKAMPATLLGRRAVRVIPKSPLKVYQTPFQLFEPAGQLRGKYLKNLVINCDSTNDVHMMVNGTEHIIPKGHGLKYVPIETLVDAPEPIPFGISFVDDPATGA